MSKLLLSTKDDKLFINSFYGGLKRNTCIQFTTSEKCYSTHTKIEVEEIIKVLQKWVEEQ